MKIKSKNAKIQHLEKTIEIGLNKIPEQEKDKIIREEKLREYKKTHDIKQDLWKLRKKENANCSLCGEAPDNKAHLFTCSSYSATAKGIKLFLDNATGPVRNQL